MRLAVVGCVVAALLLWVAATVSWAWVDYPGRTRAVKGHAMVGALTAWAVVALAAVLAILASRRRLRLPVGLAIAASGATAFAQVLDALRSFHDKAYAATAASGFQVLTAWPVRRSIAPYAGLLGGAVLAAVGVLVALRGPTWTTMAAKYDAPADRPVSDADLWSALDRGEDPTA